VKPIAISRRLASAVDALPFGPPVTHVYDPLVYARGPHEAFLERHAHVGIEALLVGMNPGPFGMAQTGVPFGEVGLVRDWLGIEGRVGKPPFEHPRRPVLGFDCPRSEVSGARLWGWARERFGTPEAFFARFFVWNYCPLVFMEDSGRNRTPDKLPASEREPLFAACDEALRAIVRALEPGRVLGVGAFATARARAVFGDALPIGTLPHPSPASPAANRGWAALADRALTEQGFALPTDRGPRRRSPPSRSAR
jgi:single-strand selective monofunctional uracil DNA glycosylase